MDRQTHYTCKLTVEEGNWSVSVHTTWKETQLTYSKYEFNKYHMLYNIMVNVDGFTLDLILLFYSGKI